MAVRSLLALCAAAGDGEGGFIDEDVVEKLSSKLAAIGANSLLAFHLLFDNEGDLLLSEARELAVNLGFAEAGDILATAAAHVREMSPAELSDEPDVVVKPLRKRKLMYGRMVMDIESESQSSLEAKGSRISFLPAPVTLRMPSEKNVKAAERAVSRWHGPPPVIAHVDKPFLEVSLQDKEVALRKKVVPMCFGLLHRIGPISSRYAVLYGSGLDPLPEMLEVQEELFFGKREPPTVKSFVKDCTAFLDWLATLDLDLAGLDSFYTATYLRLQRKRGKSVPGRVWSSLVWAQDCMKVNLGARERDVQNLAAALGTKKASKAVPAVCIPVHIIVEFEKLTIEAHTVPLQCFAGTCLLCCYGVKRWADVLHVVGESFQLTSEALVVVTYKSKKKDSSMMWVCPRRSVSGLDWMPVWIKVMSRHGFPAADHLLKCMTANFRGFTNRPADWQTMNRALHATLISFGLSAQRACVFTMHSFRHLLPSCAFQLKMAEPDVKSMGQWGATPTIARQYDSAMVAAELASKDWIVQNLAGGWRPVSAGHVAPPAIVPWLQSLALSSVPSSCCPSVPCEVVKAPNLKVADKAHKRRGEEAMHRMNRLYVLKPQVKQVRYKYGLVHLTRGKSMTLCKLWRWGADKHKKDIVFSSQPNEWDEDVRLGFCEKCYCDNVFKHAGVKRDSGSPPPPLSDVPSCSLESVDRHSAGAWDSAIPLAESDGESSSTADSSNLASDSSAS